MAWIAAVIGGVASVASSAIKADQAKGAGGLGLPSNSFADYSMNNSGFVVTTNGSTAKVTANTDSTKSPTLGQTTPLMLGGGGGGLDMTTMLLIGAAVLILKKKG